MQHLPDRPAWTCGGCGQEWPCEPARRHFLANYEDSSVSLSLVMASHFAEACRDLPHARAGELHYRFLGWIRHTAPRALWDEFRG